MYLKMILLHRLENMGFSNYVAANVSYKATRPRLTYLLHGAESFLRS